MSINPSSFVGWTITDGEGHSFRVVEHRPELASTCERCDSVADLYAVELTSSPADADSWCRAVTTECHGCLAGDLLYPDPSCPDQLTAPTTTN